MGNRRITAAHGRPLRGLVVVVIAVLAAACTSPTAEQPEPSPVSNPSPTPTSAWATCVNPADGYGIDYPHGWHTNDGDVVAPCSAFGPQPIDIEPNTEVPADVAVFITVDPVAFDEVTSDSPTQEEVSRDESTVAGRDAVRIEARADDALLPEGTLTTRWAVDLDGETLVARVTDIGEPEYARKQEVLDRMMASLSLREPSATEAPTDEGPDMVGEPADDQVVSDEFPGGSGDTAQLLDVRVGRHAGFDRVVFEFAGDDPPSFRVRYVAPPILEDPSGMEVDVEGDAFLEVNLQPASGVDLSGKDFRETYDGPDRLDVAGGVLTEVVRTSDFEAVMVWVIGAEQRAPFATTFLRDPLRFVVDVAHPDR